MPDTSLSCSDQALFIPITKWASFCEILINAQSVYETAQNFVGNLVCQFAIVENAENKEMHYLKLFVR